MLVLSNFAAGDRKQGKDIPFRYHKDEKPLVSYFQRMKELLVFYRVACREGGHFTVRAEPDAETVSPTSERQEYTQLPQDIPAFACSHIGLAALFDESVSLAG
ncbi:hypothetical protein E4U30_007782 [Claviceps sp. LM220 group G6]|nr:hypothetical protein E4U15_004121 [Claviceps sp. LM218 group G6]KAG6090939.1 hypothetical protein E4U30_007782 [Claviceps sp. LM220 group G6]KAG6095324.1 hypothetical protein E4U14_008288 [Claviceps sp. LM454 group G7]KAG6105676.1 hypothetical protein E4U31_001272 [Claviceps sp. LM219 group G6]